VTLPSAAEAVVQPLETTRRPGADLWRAVAGNRKALAGVLLLGFFLVLAIFPGQIAPHSPTAEIFPRGAGPSASHWFGTTAYGQDVLSQLIWGARQSIVIAFAVGGLATVLAVLVGVSAAYLAGLTDGVLSLLTDVILVIPIFPLIIVIAAYEKNAGLLTLIVVLGALGWSYGARQLRSQTLSLRHRDFLEAARVRGERKLYIIVFEILPTMTSLIVASFLGAALYAVLFAAGLQFIGLGNPNSQSWGTMLYWAQNNEALGAGMAWWAITPGACVALLGAALALLNYAFDEISNPALRMRRLERQGPRPTRRAAPAATTVDTGAILEVRGLSVAYASDRGPVVAVDHVDFDLAPGEFLGIVGESGCGKSTLLYAITRLLGPPLSGAITGGHVVFRGQDMVALDERRLRSIRWKELSVVM
jgi:peptide/nickel transport system permease protein